MSKTMYPVVNAPASCYNFLSKNSRASAGPRANVTGMRNLYWGVNAPIIKCCDYLFLVTPDIYYSFRCYSSN